MFVISPFSSSIFAFMTFIGPLFSSTTHLLNSSICGIFTICSLMVFIFAIRSFICSPVFFIILKSTKILLFTPFSFFISRVSAITMFEFDTSVSMTTLSAIISPPITDFITTFLAFTLPPSRRSISTSSPSKLPI